MNKKDYVINNITDAFLALNDIDDDEVVDMVKHVTRTKKLTEGKSFSVSNMNSVELEEAEKFLHKDSNTEIEVIDPDADSVEHIKDKEAYVGQAVIQCNRCKEKRFIDMDKLVADPEDPELYNIEDMCPHCKDAGSGYELIGQVGKVVKEEPQDLPAEDSLTDEEPEGLPEMENDEAIDEVEFDNDIESEDTTTEDALVQEPENLPEPEEKKLKLKLKKDDGMETTASEDEDNLDLPDLGEEYKEMFDDKDDEPVSESFFKEAEGNNEYAHEAWMMNQVIESMNNEEAYYNGWLYVWPDGETREECEYDFSDRDSFEDLKDTFIDTYRYYHDDGLYNADEETEAYAHKWDDILELDSIENIMPKRVESLDEADEEVSEEEIEEKPFSVDDLFKFMIDPEKMEDIVINGYEGTYEDTPSEIFDLNLQSFNVGDGNLVINVSKPVEDDEEAIKVEDVLKFFDDEETEKVSVVDAEEFEQLAIGTKADILEGYADYVIESIEKPVHLEIIGIDEVEEAEEEYPVDESLFEQICRENNLYTYKANRYNTAEYWLKENLTAGEDLEEVYNTYCVGKESAKRFKEEYNFKDSDDVIRNIKEELINSNNCACVYGYKYNNRPLFMESVLYANTNSQLENLIENVSYKYGCDEVLVMYNPIKEAYVVRTNKGFYDAANNDIVKDSSFATIYVTEELAQAAITEAKDYFINENLYIETIHNTLTEGMESSEPVVKEVIVEEVVKESFIDNLPTYDPLEEEVEVEESFANNEFTEFMDLAKKLGFDNLSQIDNFAKEHGNVKDQELLQAMRDEASKVTEEICPDCDPVSDDENEEVSDNEVKKELEEDKEEKFWFEIFKKEPVEEACNNEVKEEVKESVQSFATRKELTEAIKELQKNNKPYIVKRSVKEGYRFDLCEMLAPNELVQIEPETVDPEVVETRPEEGTAVVPGDLSLQEIDVLSKINRIANDICEAIEKYYNIEANPALVVADILQDLRLISGAIDVNDLEDTPINNATKAMFQDYKAGYELVNSILVELGEEPFDTTPSALLADAIKSLDSSAFSKGAIERGVASDRFLAAVEQGQIPYISREDIPQLTEEVNKSELNVSPEVTEEVEEVEEDCNESVEVDTDLFDKEINEYFDNIYKETLVYKTETGSIDETGKIILEGYLDNGDKEKKVTFTLTPMNKLNESLESAADVAKILGITNYKVTNDLSEEVFEFKFVNDTKNEEIFEMKDEEKLEIINKFMKSCPDCKKYLNSREMIKAAAEWAFNENPEYKKLGLDVCHIENFLISVMDQIDVEKLIENAEPENK